VDLAMTRISAATITATTAAAGFHDPANPQTPPTAEELINILRGQIQKKTADIKSGKLSAFHPAGGAMKMPTDIMLARAVEDQRALDELLSDVPQGFKLVPVFYSKIPSDTNRRLEREYSNRVRHLFLQFLANEHSDELRALGIAECGIERMKGGFDPIDEKGLYYEVNVDHVIERSGCGQWSKTPTPDPLQPPTIGDKYPVNHFDNLILLPESIHQFKNKLNDLQKPDNLTPGKGIWMLMLVAEETPTCSGYVCPPQDPAHPKYALQHRAEDMNTLLGRIGWAIERIEELMQKLEDHPATKAVIEKIYDISWAQKQTVADLYALPQKKLNGLTPGEAFNKAAANDNDLNGMLNNRLRPLLHETSDALSRAFTRAAKHAEKGKKGTLKSLDQYIHSQKTTAFRARLGDLPLQDALDMEKTIQSIDAQISTSLRPPAPVSRRPKNDDQHKKSSKFPRRRNW
jgi:hypothetical protein